MPLVLYPASRLRFAAGLFCHASFRHNCQSARATRKREKEKGESSAAQSTIGNRQSAIGNSVDFDHDVRPILSENCFACHGFDANKRAAGLRLDQEAGALKKLDSGRFAVVPGNVKDSELVERIYATESGQMPPLASGKKLTNAQMATLKRWIAQGGKYAKHWAFVPPVRPNLPPVKNAAWVRNPVDRFILARLEKEGLAPSPEADKITLLRRVTLDLTGLPPTPEEVAAFVADKSPDAYEKTVDRLLASPHYGERMATCVA